MPFQLHPEFTVIPLLKRIVLAMSVGAVLAGSVAHGGTQPRPPLALQGVNPDMLSGGLFAALDATGAFGSATAPSRARAVYADLGKGRPGALLDARVGVNVRLGDDPDPLPASLRGQSEPHLFRSAARPNLLLATFQEGRFAEDGGAVGNGCAVSRDGGLTWTRALIPALTTASGGPYPRATDPVAAIGPQGDLYLNGLASIDRAFGLAAVVIQRSTDEGVTWSPPTVIYQSPDRQNFPDKNWFVVNDYPAGPNAGRLVATWTQFTSTAAGTATGNHLVAALSDDRGATWSPPANITPAGSSNQGTQPFFLPDGSLGVVYITFLNSSNVAQFSLNYKYSADGGRTFPNAATTIVGFVPGWDDPELRDGIFLPSASVARDTGEIFVTYVAVVAGTPRILVTRSSDRGSTWTTPVVVSDQPAGRSVCNPAVTVSADGRTVSIVFIDKRHAPDGRGFVDLTAAVSFDGGVSWQPNTRLTETSSDLQHGPPTTRGVMLGDYLAVVAPAGSDRSAVAIWCDTRTGDSDPWTVRFTPAAAPDYGAWVVARRVRGTYLEDDDDDGMPNYLEYLQGTNPLQAENGDGLFVRTISPTSIDVAWMERPNVVRNPVSDGIAVARMSHYLAGGFSMSATLPSSLAPEHLADLPAREGLAWRGVRVEIQPGDAYAIAPAIHFSAGLPTTPARPVVTCHTDARLINVSTRGFAGAGSSQLIVGFAVDGQKSVLVRAAGPALADFGVANALRDPRLSITVPSTDPPVTNDQWQQGSATAALFQRLGAFPFTAGSADAAVLLPAAERNYTAIVSGAGDSTGVALVEAYDADSVPGSPGRPRLLNLSTRGEAGTGANTLVAGFALGGSQPRRVLIRAVGPGLRDFGVGGVLADPVLTLFRGDVTLGSNDDWEISRSSAAVAATAHRVGAFPLHAGTRDAALLVTLSPGIYTAVVSSADGGSGVALVEVYDAD